MKPNSMERLAKPGDRTGTTCPVCGNPVLQQERYGSNGAHAGFRLVCSLRGCPWQRAAG